MNKHYRGSVALSALLLALQGCSSADDTLDLDPNSGGDTSIVSATSNAFATPAPNLDAAGLNTHLDGDAAFEAAFVTADAANLNNPGLGPVFNNTSCIACHPKDGRGRPPIDGETRMETMFLRVSIGNDPINGPIGAPGMGGQLQHRGLLGVPPEADANFSYAEFADQFDDATPYSLRVPSYSVSNPGDPAALAAAGVTLDELLLSPRVAPPVFGRGLLEAIPDATLLALADENDADGDGISGRPNRVWNTLLNKTVIGRFGLKANNATLELQNAGAYNQDMGVTNTVFPDDPAKDQVQDDGRGDDPELGFDTLAGIPNETAAQKDLDDVTFYTQTLAVPARRDVNDAEVQQGQRLFASAQCAACHTPTLQTGDSAIAELANQIIHPYSDMLLHDMGDSLAGTGLADGRPDFLADGNEWRTPPLWGIGLTEVVHNHTFFLHDGRARNVSEAILWHGGEADAARLAYLAMSAEERAALLRFINSL